MAKLLKDILISEGIEHLFKNRAVGMISAVKGHHTEKQNADLTSQLGKALKNRGHTVIPAKGGYVKILFFISLIIQMLHHFMVQQMAFGREKEKLNL